jgi:hypothetical protein
MPTVLYAPIWLTTYANVAVEHVLEKPNLLRSRGNASGGLGAIGETLDPR